MGANQKISLLPNPPNKMLVFQLSENPQKPTSKSAKVSISIEKVAPKSAVFPNLPPRGGRRGLAEVQPQNRGRRFFQRIPLLLLLLMLSLLMLLLLSLLLSLCWWHSCSAAAAAFGVAAAVQVKISTLFDLFQMAI